MLESRIQVWSSSLAVNVSIHMLESAWVETLVCYSCSEGTAGWQMGARVGHGPGPNTCNGKREWVALSVAGSDLAAQMPFLSVWSGGGSGLVARRTYGSCPLGLPDRHQSACPIPPLWQQHDI